ncbi:MAG TPA: GntR family transcriptional regulator, partial [Candidatus Acidoferrum sp.]|nr:GntR family transcriptional regulator [Candidatus Acidoferrum sp.]
MKLGGGIAGWRLGEGPLHRRLADSLRDVIERGDLVAGAQLPPERMLARQLGLSRTTVISAYDLLREQGWLQSRRGSGTFVAAPKAIDGHRDQLMAQLARNPIFSGLIDSPTATIDFAAASPRATTQLLPAARLAMNDLEPHLRRHGYFTSGLPAL